MQKDALYYPHIGFTNAPLIKSLALFYDRIYRIVPNNLAPEDDSELQPLLEGGLVGAMVDPVKYADGASRDFLSKLDGWGAAALCHEKKEEAKISRIHRDKIDWEVQRLFENAGYKFDNEWLHVPTKLASNYMLYLDTEIAEKNSLSLVTQNWGAWTGTSYFRLDGQLDESITPETSLELLDDPYSLFGLIISELLPINIGEIPAEKILQFREKRVDEITRFRQAIFDLENELSTLDAEDIKIDRIQDKVSELERAKLDYQGAADLIKAKKWFGISLMGFPAPIFLGKLLGIPTASTITLGAAGLAIGALYSIKNSRQALHELNKKNVSSYLIALERHFKNYTNARGGGDINHHAWNCMEEYVND